MNTYNAIQCYQIRSRIQATSKITGSQDYASHDLGIHLGTCWNYHNEQPRRSESATHSWQTKGSTQQ